MPVLLLLSFAARRCQFDWMKCAARRRENPLDKSAARMRPGSKRDAG